MPPSDASLPPETDRLLHAVLGAVRGKRFRYRDEIELHEGLAAAFTASGITHQREVTLSGGRIDFVVDRLGIEVKVKGTVTALERQIARYAVEDRLAGFLVITTRATHAALPRTINLKPVTVHRLGGFGL